MLRRRLRNNGQQRKRRNSSRRSRPHNNKPHNKRAIELSRRQATEHSTATGGALSRQFREAGFQSTRWVQALKNWRKWEMTSSGAGTVEANSFDHFSGNFLTVRSG